MRPDARFRLQPPEFWANVRLISQKVGYTFRGEVRVPTLAEMRSAFESLGLDPSPVVGKTDEPTKLGAKLVSYYEYRARVLNDEVRLLLMDKDEARAEFEALFEELKPSGSVRPSVFGSW